jgi:hypothetical protein
MSVQRQAHNRLQLGLECAEIATQAVHSNRSCTRDLFSAGGTKQQARDLDMLPILLRCCRLQQAQRLPGFLSGFFLRA